MRALGATPTLRPERDGDAAFRSSLFAAQHAPPLAASAAAGDAVSFLVAMQFRAQADSYRVRFPDARHLIVESGGRPVGRIIVAAEPSDLYVVDIAVHPDARGLGLGGAALAILQDEAAGRCLGIRALVMPDNGPSLAMFRRRGFSETGRVVGLSLELRWTA